MNLSAAKVAIVQGSNDSGGGGGDIVRKHLSLRVVSERTNLLSQRTRWRRQSDCRQHTQCNCCCKRAASQLLLLQQLHTVQCAHVTVGEWGEELAYRLQCACRLPAGNACIRCDCSYQLLLLPPPLLRHLMAPVDHGSRECSVEFCGAFGQRNN